MANFDMENGTSAFGLELNQTQVITYHLYIFWKFILQKMPFLAFVSKAEKIVSNRNSFLSLISSNILLHEKLKWWGQNQYEMIFSKPEILKKPMETEEMLGFPEIMY